MRQDIFKKPIHQSKQKTSRGVTVHDDVREKGLLNSYKLFNFFESRDISFSTVKVKTKLT